MALPESGRTAAALPSLALDSATGAAYPKDLPPEALGVISPTSFRSTQSPRRLKSGSPRGRHVTMDRLLEIEQTNSGQLPSPRKAMSGYPLQSSPRSQKQQESQLIVHRQRPIVYGEYLEAQCVLAGADMAFILNNADAAVHAITVDAGSMQAEELSPSGALRCRGVCERFMACKPKRLKDRNRQKFQVKPKPLRFVDVDGAEESCLCLQLVVTASCLGPDMWRQIGQPHFFQVVRPREWEAEFLRRVARVDAIFRGFSLHLRGMSTVPSKLSALADDIIITVETMWSRIKQSHAELPYSKAMQEMIQFHLKDFVIEPIQDTYAMTSSGFPKITDLARLTYRECLACLKLGNFSKFWTTYFEKSFGGLIDQIHATAKWHGSELIGKTLHPTLLGKGAITQQANKINIDIKHGALEPGDEVQIGDEFHRVLRLGSIVTCCDIQAGSSENLDVRKLNIALLIPATTADKGKTLNFIEAVEVYDTKTHETKMQDLLQGLSVEPLPQEEEQRKEKLIELYTSNKLYGEVNRSMYQDDAEALERNAPYIRELRDCFLFGQTGCRVVDPFTGRVVRGAKLPPEMLEEYVGMFNSGSKQVVYWSSFTSTKAADSQQDAPDSAFGGNATFKLHLTYKDWKEGQYFPASIEKYSVFKSEREVLLPPHFGFRIVNVAYEGEGKDRTYTFDLEPADAPHVWDVLEEGKWETFKVWADLNPELVNTRGKVRSLINAVAENLPSGAEAGTGPNPLATCVKHGANVNEVDPKTKETPFSNLSKRWDSENTRLKASLDLLMSKGANPNIGCHRKPQDYEEPPAPPEEDLHWMYWVEDGIDGKDTGWYPYDDSAEKEVERVFKEWMNSGSEGAANIQSLKSGHFSYDIDFSFMQQTNTSSGKRRTIRRHVQPLGESLRLAGQCPNGYKWRKEDGGYRCEGGSHFVPFTKVEYSD